MVDWGVVCLLAAYCGPNSPLARAMGSRQLAPRYYSQCQSAATSEVVKEPLSRVVSGAISSELPFTF